MSSTGEATAPPNAEDLSQTLGLKRQSWAGTREAGSAAFCGCHYPSPPPPGTEPLSRLRSGQAAQAWCPGRAGRSRSEPLSSGGGRPQAEGPWPRGPWAGCSHAEPSGWLAASQQLRSRTDVLKPDTRMREKTRLARGIVPRCF